MSSLIFNPSNVGNGSVTLNIFGDDKQYNINLPKTNATLIGSVNGKSANENGSVTIDVGVKTVNGVTPDSEGNVTVKVQSIASNSDVISGTDNTKMMTPLRTKESVQQFSPNDYVINLSVSGQTVTFNKKDGTSGSIITQDTKYTHPNSGVKAGTYNTVTVNEQGHVTNGSNVNYVKSLSGNQADGIGNINLHTVAFNGDYNSLENKPTVTVTPKRYINETGASGTTRWEKYNDGFKKLWMTVSGTVQTNFPFSFSANPNVTCARYGSPDHVHDVFTVSTTGIKFTGAAVGSGVKYDICVSGF